jgi:peptide/nickel transport system ATP-binding protein
MSPLGGRRAAHTAVTATRSLAARAHTLLRVLPQPMSVAEAPTSPPNAAATAPGAADDVLLSIDSLRMYFHLREGTVKAVDNISVAIRRGQTLGVVGESGSGKSMTAMSVLRLIPEPPGRIEGGAIYFNGTNLVALSEAKLRRIRGSDISMIFQEPMTSLNPVFTVGNQIMEAIIVHQGVPKAEARRRAIRLIEEVGIPQPESRIDSYPHQMSGGMKQRVMIAMALACNPKLLIADEPTTALDVTIQRQIIDLLRDLRDKRNMAILFISHDLGVIAEICDHVAVMFKGKIVEYGPIFDVFTHPQHPYTQGLLACRPPLDLRISRLSTVQEFLEGKAEFDERGISKATHIISDEELAGRRARLAQERPFLEVRDLKVHFPIRKGLFGRTVGHVKAVDGVSFDLVRGQTLGLVGESGCGKTTTGRAILRLIEPTAGSVMFDGEDWLALRGGNLRRRRRKIQMVFQDPYSSLNPRMTVLSTIEEGMIIHNTQPNKRARRDRVVDLLEKVGLGAEHMTRFPHEFSGGQRQRIAIARALAADPELVICDESVSALDVSVQAQILNLLKDLQDQLGVAYIFISHDLSVIKFMSDEIAVMYDGKIVEMGEAEEVYHRPKHDYTKKLIAAIPKSTPEEIRDRQISRGLMQP